MFQPLIGLWWYTDDKDIISLRQSIASGVEFGSYVVSTYIHKSGWKLALPSISKYFGVNPSSFIKGSVIYDLKQCSYIILCEDITLFHDENFKSQVVKEFHLEDSCYKFQEQDLEN